MGRRIYLFNFALGDCRARVFNVLFERLRPFFLNSPFFPLVNAASTFVRTALSRDRIDARFVGARASYFWRFLCNGNDDRLRGSTFSGFGEVESKSSVSLRMINQLWTLDEAKIMSIKSNYVFRTPFLLSGTFFVTR